MRDWTAEFPFSPNRLVMYDDEKGIMARRSWCLENIGAQNDQWCIIHTVYRGSRQFRFKDPNNLLLYKMVWE